MDWSIKYAKIVYDLDNVTGSLWQIASHLTSAGAPAKTSFTCFHMLLHEYLM